MWPFSRHRRQKEELKKAFSQYVSPKVAEDIVENRIPDGPLTELTKKKIYYVFILVDDSDINRTPDIISSVVQLAQDNNGIVDTITGSLIIIHCGFFADEGSPDENKKQLIEDLIKTHGNLLSIIHGSETCVVGNVGGDSIMSFTALVPNYKEKLFRLASLKYGEQLEIE
jgi:hypothetical protein